MLIWKLGFIFIKLIFLEMSDFIFLMCRLFIEIR